MLYLPWSCTRKILLLSWINFPGVTGINEVNSISLYLCTDANLSVKRKQAEWEQHSGGQSCFFVIQSNCLKCERVLSTKDPFVSHRVLRFSRYLGVILICDCRCTAYNNSLIFLCCSPNATKQSLLSKFFQCLQDKLLCVVLFQRNWLPQYRISSLT